MKDLVDCLPWIDLDIWKLYKLQVMKDLVDYLPWIDFKTWKLYKLQAIKVLVDCLPCIDSSIVVVVCVQEPVATLGSVGKIELKKNWNNCLSIINLWIWFFFQNLNKIFRFWVKMACKLISVFNLLIKIWYGNCFFRIFCPVKQSYVKNSF